MKSRIRKQKGREKDPKGYKNSKGSKGWKNREDDTFSQYGAKFDGVARAETKMDEKTSFYVRAICPPEIVKTNYKVG